MSLSKPVIPEEASSLPTMSNRHKLSLYVLNAPISIKVSQDPQPNNHEEEIEMKEMPSSSTASANSSSKSASNQGLQVANDAGAAPVTQPFVETQVSEEDQETCFWIQLIPKCGVCRWRRNGNGEPQASPPSVEGTAERNALSDNPIGSTELPRPETSGDDGVEVFEDATDNEDFEIVIHEAKDGDVQVFVTNRNELSSYMNVMHAAGVSPCGGEEPTGVCSWIKRIFTTIYSTVSVFHSLKSLKRSIMEYLFEKGKVETYLDVAIDGMTLFTKGVFLRLLCCKPWCIFRVSEKINEASSFGKPDDSKWFSAKNLGIALAVCTVISVVVRALFGYYKFEGWDTAEEIKFQAYIMAGGLLNWNATNFRNDTNDIFQSFLASNMTAEIVGYAATNVTTNYCGWSQFDLIRDIILILAKKLNEEFARFIKSIEASGQTTEQKKRSVLWLSCLRQLCEVINDNFGLVISLMHGVNLLVICDFLVDSLNKRFSIHTLIGGLFRLCKIIATFYYSIKARLMNKKVLVWLRANRDLEPVVDESGEEITISDLIDLTEKEPIGLGLDGFKMDVEFLKQYGMAAVSLFLFFAKSQGENEMHPCTFNYDLMKNNTAELLKNFTFHM